MMFKDFQKTSKAEWRDQILKDLKGKSHDILEFQDEIEGINFDAYYHVEDKVQNQQPGDFPFTRGFNRADNEWTILSRVIVTDENKANKQALDLLMKGASGILFEIKSDNVDWNTLTENIGFEFIKCQFKLATNDQLNEVKAVLKESQLNNTDFILPSIATDSNINSRTVAVEAFQINLIGGNATQEVVYAISKGHSLLVELMEAGLSIDEAANKIHFHMSIGEKYFVEIAKFRAAHLLWSKVIHAYEPKDKSSYKFSCTAITTMRNKSLNDPYTNLLRQTTEALSAVNAGVDSLLVETYDSLSENGASDFTQRMAINISLLLKEESYTNKVIDPAGGSYSIEKLTNIIGENAWEQFKTIESKGGIETTLNEFLSEVDTIRNRRISKVANGETTLIGVNKFTNPDEPKLNWRNELPKYFGRDQLILEVEALKAV